jgi:hypothetical protein
LRGGLGRRVIFEVREPELGQHPSDADEDIAGAGLAGLRGLSGLNPSIAEKV